MRINWGPVDRHLSRFGGDHFETGRRGGGARQRAGFAGSALGLNDVNQLVENDRDQNHRADDDESPVVIQPPDSADAAGIGAEPLEHVNAVVDHAHDAGADDDADHGALAAAQGDAPEDGGGDGV